MDQEKRKRKSLRKLSSGLRHILYQLCYVMLQLRAVTLIAHPHEVVKEATFLIMFYCDYFIELSQIIDVELNMDYRYSLC